MIDIEMLRNVPPDQRVAALVAAGIHLATDEDFAAAENDPRVITAAGAAGASELLAAAPLPHWADRSKWIVAKRRVGGITLTAHDSYGDAFRRFKGLLRRAPKSNPEWALVIWRPTRD